MNIKQEQQPIPCQERGISVFDKEWPESLRATFDSVKHDPEDIEPETPERQPLRRSTRATSKYYADAERSQQAKMPKDEPRWPAATAAAAPNRGKKPRARTPPSRERFGLVQESLAHDLYALVVQAILWNQTTGRQARPVLRQLLAAYPDPAALSRAKFEDVAEMLRPIGLYNSRGQRLIDMAARWLAQPPVPGRGYARTRDRKYAAVPLPALEETVRTPGKEGPASAAAASAAAPLVSSELKEEATKHEAATQASFWEIAHLPGVGPYALDSFRIFHRDEMRGLCRDWLGNGADTVDFEPEWKRVLPMDKELRAYLKWLWAREGWDWNWETGRRKRCKS